MVVHGGGGVARMMKRYDEGDWQHQLSEEVLFMSDAIEIKPQADLNMGGVARENLGFISDAILITPGDHSSALANQDLNILDTKKQDQFPTAHMTVSSPVDSEAQPQEIPVAEQGHESAGPSKQPKFPQV
jgi:hypothetical protein